MVKQDAAKLQQWMSQSADIQKKIAQADTPKGMNRAARSRTAGTTKVKVVKIPKYHRN